MYVVSLVHNNDVNTFGCNTTTTTTPSIPPSPRNHAKVESRSLAITNASHELNWCFHTGCPVIRGKSCNVHVSIIIISTLLINSPIKA